MKVTQIVFLSLFAVTTAFAQNRPYTPVQSSGVRGGYTSGAPSMNYNRPNTSYGGGGQVRYPEYGNRPSQPVWGGGAQPGYGSRTNPVLQPSHHGSRSNWNVNVGINTGWNTGWWGSGWNNGWNTGWNTGWNNCWNCGWGNPWNVYNRPIVGWSTDVPYFPAQSPITFIEQRTVPVYIDRPVYVEPQVQYRQPAPRATAPLDNKWEPVSPTDLALQQKLNRVDQLLRQGTITEQEAREARADIIYEATQ